MNRHRFRSPWGALIIAALGGPALRAQTPPVELAPVVTVADRLPEPSGSVGADVESLDGAELRRQQLYGLSEALSGAAGSPLFAAGRSGASASLFLRGANSDQAVFLVDGVRMSDANADYGPFLGAARVFAGDRIEVARGPQSSLYGGGAGGGVVSLALRKGQGSSGEVSAEAGSFGTVDGELALQGASGRWAYNVAAAGARTDNDRPNNTLESANLAARFDGSFGPYLQAGLTLRGLDARYGDPGDEFTNDPYAYEREKNWLGTLFLDARWSRNFSSRLVLGGQDRRFDAFTRFGGVPDDSVTRDRRGTLDWQNQLQLTASNRLLLGLTEEAETARSNGFGLIDRRQTVASLYAEDQWTLFPGFTLTGGLRRDHYDTFGSASTGRATAAWLMAQGAVKLRGSYGTAFNAPSFLDLYARDPFFVGNPNLRPERSRGEDAGVDFYAPNRVDSVSATWFRTDFRNLISDNFAVFPATTLNLGSARTEGWELAVRTLLAGAVRAKAAYTRLSSQDNATGLPLLRRPRYAASADFSCDLGAGFSVGAGGAWVGGRADVDARTFATTRDPSYAVARLYAEWKASKRVTLKARAENLFDKRYEAVNGYPALGRGLFAGAAYSW